MGLDVHEEQRGDDGDVGDGVDEEAESFADVVDQEAGGGGADRAGGVHHGGVEGDRVGEILPVLHHLDGEGLAGGHVEAVDQALTKCKRDDLPDFDMGECEQGQRERLQAGKDLGDDQELAFVPAVRPDATERGEEEERDLPGEGDGAEEQGVSGQAEDQPDGGDLGEEGADQGDHLADEEEAVVARAECAEEAPGFFGGSIVEHRRGH